MRVLLLMPTTTYRADDFLAAADRLGVEVVLGSDRCHVLESQGAVPLTRDSVVLDLLDPEESARRIVAYASSSPLDGVVATDDPTTVVAALATGALGLPHNPVGAARASRDKREMRGRFAEGGVRQPRFRELPLSLPAVEAAARAAADPGFPCVVKPRSLSASRGVIRADDEPGFAAAFERVRKILSDPEVRARAGDTAGSVLVESFVPGGEVALEGLLTDGRLEVLALFDKPDPLDGPFFEETIYVTPSRLPSSTQDAILAETARAAAALGLVEGPVHAELRVAAGGPHVLEIAARSIGGLCSRALRFGAGMSLEEVILRHAVARGSSMRPDRRPPDGTPVTRDPSRPAAGVMMLPIPATGVFRGIDGIEAAKAVPGIEELSITAQTGRTVVALPEGSSYLGFLFARGESPESVERSLRDAHRRLDVRIAASLNKA